LNCDTMACLDLGVKTSIDDLVFSFASCVLVLNDWCGAANKVECCIVDFENNRLAANHTVSAAWYILYRYSEGAFLFITTTVLGKYVRAGTLEVEVFAVECDIVTITIGGAGGTTWLICAGHMAFFASAFVAVLLDNSAFCDDLTLEATWALFRKDAESGDGVEDKAWSASTSGCGAGRCWAFEVHVEASLLAIGALVPDLIECASVLTAVIFGAEPLTTGACANIALFITGGAILVVNSLEQTLAFSLNYALVRFFINNLTRQTAAA
jgi:hypothetical protein